MRNCFLVKFQGPEGMWAAVTAPESGSHGSDARELEGTGAMLQTPGTQQSLGSLKVVRFLLRKVSVGPRQHFGALACSPLQTR